MMEDFKITKSRREFLRDGLRTVLFGGLAFTGLFLLGWRGHSNSGKESSCLVRLPCRGCSKLPDCQVPRAIDARQKTPSPSRLQSSKMNREVRDGR
jgi:hypothetical protein